MKPDIFQQLEKLSRHNPVRKEWQASTKRILVAYMDAHPKMRRASGISWYYSKFFIKTASVLAVVVLMAVGVTGVTLAAQTSIPGDALYAWKVGVENFESVFIVGTQSRVEFEVERTTKRLHEVTELAVRKPADTDLSHEAHVRLQAQVKVTAEEIAKVASENPQKALDAAVTLQSTLQAHKDILDQLAPKVVDSTKPQIQNALDAIGETTDQVEVKIQDLRTKTQDDIVAAHATEAIQTDAKAKLEEVQKAIDEAWDQISALAEGQTVRDEAEARIDAAQNALSDAQDAYAKAEYADTLIALQSSARLLSETSALIEATQQAGIAVKEILAVPSHAPSPSQSPSQSPAAPTKAPAPLLTPTPTATPVITPIISIAINKTTYVPTEIIIVTVKATNPAAEPLTLNWQSGCQVDAAIDDHPSTFGLACVAGATSATIPTQQSFTWVFTLAAPLAAGTHVMNAEVFGYGKVDVKFDVSSL
ncbi:MAG: DUF5667 domain-containing protein [Patescibacteria group bacterium]